MYKGKRIRGQLLIKNIRNTKKLASTRQELFRNLDAHFFFGAVVDAVPYHREAPRANGLRDFVGVLDLSSDYWPGRPMRGEGWKPDLEHVLFSID